MTAGHALNGRLARLPFTGTCVDCGAVWLQSASGSGRWGERCRAGLGRGLQEDLALRGGLAAAAREHETRDDEREPHARDGRRHDPRRPRVSPGRGGVTAGRWPGAASWLGDRLMGAVLRVAVPSEVVLPSEAAGLAEGDCGGPPDGGGRTVAGLPEGSARTPRATGRGCRAVALRVGDRLAADLRVGTGHVRIPPEPAAFRPTRSSRCTPRPARGRSRAKARAVARPLRAG